MASWSLTRRKATLRTSVVVIFAVRFACWVAITTSLIFANSPAVSRMVIRSQLTLGFSGKAAGCAGRIAVAVTATGGGRDAVAGVGAGMAADMDAVCCRMRAFIRSLESVGFIVINYERLNV